MSKKTKSYQVYEGLRCALALTFISGFVNAFTFLTQERRFAGVQTGNLLSFGLQLAEGNSDKAMHFLLPIVVFMMGQVFVYLAHRWADQRGLYWQLMASLLMLSLAIVTIVFTPDFGASFTIAMLSFFASIQVDTFKSLRGATYANVMMTGNIKNAAYLWTKGLVEKNPAMRHIGRNTFAVILAFLAGVLTSSYLVKEWGELTLIFMLVPILYVNGLLYREYRLEKS